MDGNSLCKWYGGRSSNFSFKASSHICRKHLGFFLSLLLFTKSKWMHLRLIVMIAKITKTFHMQKDIFVWVKVWKVLCQSCIQRPALRGLSSIMWLLEGFCFLGVFSFSFIFMRFVLLVLCNIFTGSFLWTLHMRWMKELVLLCKSASLICLLALEISPEFRKPSGNLHQHFRMLQHTALKFERPFCSAIMLLEGMCYLSVRGFRRGGWSTHKNEKIFLWLNSMFLMKIVSSS